MTGLRMKFNRTQTWSAPSQTVERRLQHCPRNLVGGASLLIIFVVNICLYLQIVFCCWSLWLVVYLAWSYLLSIFVSLCKLFFCWSFMAGYVSPWSYFLSMFICICCYNLPPIDPNCQSIELETRKCHLCGTPAPLELSCTGVGWSCRRGSASSLPDHLCTWPWVLWGHWYYQFDREDVVDDIMRLLKQLAPPAIKPKEGESGSPCLISPPSAQDEATLRANNSKTASKVLRKKIQGKSSQKFLEREYSPLIVDKPLTL